VIDQESMLTAEVPVVTRSASEIVQLAKETFDWGRYEKVAFVKAPTLDVTLMASKTVLELELPTVMDDALTKVFDPIRRLAEVATFPPLKNPVTKIDDPKIPETYPLPLVRAPFAEPFAVTMVVAMVFTMAFARATRVVMVLFASDWMGVNCSATAL